MVLDFTVANLKEYFEAVSSIGAQCDMNGGGPKFSPIWFRGHQYQHYNLLPSELRKIIVKPNHARSYSCDHLYEEYRYQSFKSHVFHLLQSKPDSRIEWQEIMQHHFTWTRLMDWSESAVTALLFALESFIDPRDEETQKCRRKDVTPVVWVLRPYMLNKQVYTMLHSNVDNRYPYIETALRDIIGSKAALQAASRRIGAELANNIQVYFSCYDEPKRKDKAIIDGMIGLSVIEEYRRANANRIPMMVQNFEYNPFFYLLSRYYSDGLCTPFSDTIRLPPLAIIHPYHSERIRAQRGAFTVYPFIFDGDDEVQAKKAAMIRELGIDLQAMEYWQELHPYLYKIRICNPDKVAKELLLTGEKLSSIYPDPQRYSDDIESITYHV